MPSEVIDLDTLEIVSFNDGYIKDVEKLYLNEQLIWEKPASTYTDLEYDWILFDTRARVVQTENNSNYMYSYRGTGISFWDIADEIPEDAAGVETTTFGVWGNTTIYNPITPDNMYAFPQYLPDWLVGQHDIGTSWAYALGVDDNGSSTYFSRDDINNKVIQDGTIFPMELTYHSDPWYDFKKYPEEGGNLGIGVQLVGEKLATLQTQYEERKIYFQQAQFTQNALINDPEHPDANEAGYLIADKYDYTNREDELNRDATLQDLTLQLDFHELTAALDTYNDHPDDSVWLTEDGARYWPNLDVHRTLTGDITSIGYFKLNTDGTISKTGTEKPAGWTFTGNDSNLEQNQVDYPHNAESLVTRAYGTENSTSRSYNGFTGTWTQMGNDLVITSFDMGSNYSSLGGNWSSGNQVVFPNWFTVADKSTVAGQWIFFDSSNNGSFGFSGVYVTCYDASNPSMSPISSDVVWWPQQSEKNGQNASAEAQRQSYLPVPPEYDNINRAGFDGTKTLSQIITEETGLQESEYTILEARLPITDFSYFDADWARSNNLIEQTQVLKFRNNWNSAGQTIGYSSTSDNLTVGEWYQGDKLYEYVGPATNIYNSATWETDYPNGRPDRADVFLPVRSRFYDWRSSYYGGQQHYNAWLLSGEKLNIDSTILTLSGNDAQYQGQRLLDQKVAGIDFPDSNSYINLEYIKIGSIKKHSYTQSRETFTSVIGGQYTNGVYSETSTLTTGTGSDIRPIADSDGNFTGIINTTTIDADGDGRDDTGILYPDDHYLSSSYTSFPFKAGQMEYAGLNQYHQYYQGYFESINYHPRYRSRPVVTSYSGSILSAELTSTPVYSSADGSQSSTLFNHEWELTLAQNTTYFGKGYNLELKYEFLDFPIDQSEYTYAYCNTWSVDPRNIRGQSTFAYSNTRRPHPYVRLSSVTGIAEDYNTELPGPAVDTETGPFTITPTELSTFPGRCKISVRVLDLESQVSKPDQSYVHLNSYVEDGVTQYVAYMTPAAWEIKDAGGTVLHTITPELEYSNTSNLSEAAAQTKAIEDLAVREQEVKQEAFAWLYQNPQHAIEIHDFGEQFTIENVIDVNEYGIQNDSRSLGIELFENTYQDFSLINKLAKFRVIQQNQNITDQLDGSYLSPRSYAGFNAIETLYLNTVGGTPRVITTGTMEVYDSSAWELISDPSDTPLVWGGTMAYGGEADATTGFPEVPTKAYSVESNFGYVPIYPSLSTNDDEFPEANNGSYRVRGVWYDEHHRYRSDYFGKHADKYYSPSEVFINTGANEYQHCLDYTPGATVWAFQQNIELYGQWCMVGLRPTWNGRHMKQVPGMYGGFRNVASPSTNFRSEAYNLGSDVEGAIFIDTMVWDNDGTDGNIRVNSSSSAEAYNEGQLYGQAPWVWYDGSAQISDKLANYAFGFGLDETGYEMSEADAQRAQARGPFLWLPALWHGYTQTSLLVGNTNTNIHDYLFSPSFSSNQDFQNGFKINGIGDPYLMPTGTISNRYDEVMDPAKVALLSTDPVQDTRTIVHTTPGKKGLFGWSDSFWGGSSGTTHTYTLDALGAPNSYARTGNVPPEFTNYIEGRRLINVQHANPGSELYDDPTQYETIRLYRIA